MTKPILSVVVCTANRNHLLETCLSSLLTQSYNMKLYEIIVVDNTINSNSKTLCIKYGNKIKYFNEKNIGLSFARNRGWKEASAPYIAYIDDDAFADKDWVKNIAQFINRHPRICAFGGPFDRFAHVSIPDWYPDDFYVFNLGSKTRPLVAFKEWLSGTNMIFKKSILKKYNGFNTSLGMAGSTVAYGEETNLQARLLKYEKLPIYYVPSIKVNHLLATEKINLYWLLWSRYKLGKSIVESHYRKDTISYHIASFAHKFMIMIYYTFLPKAIPLKKRIYLAFSGYFSAAGAFENYLKNKFQK